MVLRVGILDGFDHYPSASSFRTVWIPTAGGPPNVSFNTGLSGNGQRLEFNGALNAGSGALTRPVKGAPSAKATWLFSLLYSDMKNIGCHYELADQFGNRQFGFGMTALGKLGLYGEGGALLAQSNLAIAVGGIYRLCVTVDMTGGLNLLTVSINGVVDAGLSVNGLDIVDSASSSLVGGIRITSGTFQSQHSIDDIFLGLDECIELGPKEVLTSAPTEQVLAQFTPSALTNLDNVNEAQSNLDVDYNHTDTVGAKDIFGYANFARVPESIIAIGMVTHARKEQSATRKLRQILKSGGLEYLGDELPLSESYLWFDDYWLKNPNGNVDWTPATHNATEGGYTLSANA